MVTLHLSSKKKPNKQLVLVLLNLNKPPLLNINKHLPQKYKIPMNNNLLLNKRNHLQLRESDLLLPVKLYNNTLMVRNLCLIKWSLKINCILKWIDSYLPILMELVSGFIKRKKLIFLSIMRIYHLSQIKEHLNKLLINKNSNLPNLRLKIR